MSVLTQERFQLILSAVQEKKAVTVPELAQMLNASESTIRRDLNTLDEQGLLCKVHGGATVLQMEKRSTYEEDMKTKSVLHVAEKEAVAQYAAGLVNDDDFVYLDAGTTTGAVIPHLTAAGATYVTNGINHAIRLADRGFKVFVLGGAFKSTTEAIVGATALQSVRGYNFTKCFLGTNGIDVAAGLTTPDPEEAILKSEVMSRSFMAYVLADSSKFGRVSSLTYAPLGNFCIITDRLPDASYREHVMVKEVPPQ